MNSTRIFVRIFLLGVLALLVGCGGGSGAASSPRLVGITIHQANASMVLGGGGLQFSATGTYSDSSIVDLTSSVIWSSSDATVATISNAAGSNGKATALSGGTILITASSGGVSGSSTLSVVPIGGTSQGTPLALTGAVTTIAGSATFFNQPVGITSDGRNLYVADSATHIIRRIVISTGVITTLAGSGQPATVDDTGIKAQFYYPGAITTDGTHLFVAEAQSGKIRKIVISTGVVTTLATSLALSSPAGITTDGASLYVTDSGTHTIHKISTSSGAVSTLAGAAGQPGSTDAGGTAARFNQPVGITTDGVNLYVNDFGNSIIRKIDISNGMVTTLAGTAAGLQNPATGITTDGTNLYVADYGTHTIRKIVISTGVVTTLAGSATLSGSADGDGAAARFNFPGGITSDGKSLFISDSGNKTIRKID